MAASISQIQSRLMTVNLRQAFDHPLVITPRDRSSVSKFYSQSGSNYDTPVSARDELTPEASVANLYRD